MTALRQSLRRIPYWAYLLILFVIVVKTTWIIFTYRTPVDGIRADLLNEKWFISQIEPGGPADKAGLRVGDHVISVDSMDFVKFYYTRYPPEIGETALYRIERGGKEMIILFTFGCLSANILGFFTGVYILFTICSIAAIYILLKKPGDTAARIFFLYIQLFAITSNSGYLGSQSPFALFVNASFVLAFTLLGAVLVHFHLLFPRHSVFYKKFRQLPAIIYGIGIILSLYASVLLFLSVYKPFPQSDAIFSKATDYTLRFSALTFFFALIVVIFQYITIKSTLERNQLRILIIGSFFAFFTPMTMAFFPGLFMYINFPYNVEVIHVLGSVITIICILVALFRYRIWDIEVFIRQALLYLGATLVIILTYLFLIWITDRLVLSENNLIHFLVLGVSVIIFLVLRDRIQRMIDRLFHRESYDSATVVSDFEEKLAGVYHPDELKSRIVQSLDEIFHFKSFVFALKTKEYRYKPAVVTGPDAQRITVEFDGNTELEKKLRKSKIFSPEELNCKPSFFDIINGELVVPLQAGYQPSGFFICGQKQSERVYSLQDIQVLSLLARRVTALFHTASLYQKDLDRQLMLERERARISQDMHDDIGAGLTKIAMISESPAKIIPTADYRLPTANCQLPTADCRLPTADPDPDSDHRIKELRDRMNHVASSARDMISRLNVIVWALNPKYDTLDSLVAYSRRFFGEYLDNSGIRFKMKVPDEIPDLSITPDFRRNVFYAMQEAIHNAVKHGACTEIILGWKIGPNNMEIAITDNGKGFDKPKPGSGGNGLLNMKKRLEDLGGSLEIQSVPGKGTRVLFLVTLTGSTTLTGQIP